MSYFTVPYLPGEISVERRLETKPGVVIEEWNYEAMNLRSKVLTSICPLCGKGFDPGQMVIPQHGSFYHWLCKIEAPWAKLRDLL
jgi:hypothetical protein